MERIRKTKKEKENKEDVFSLFQDYLKKVIAKDLNTIYGGRAYFMPSGSDEPWIFYTTE